MNNSKALITSLLILTVFFSSVWLTNVNSKDALVNLGLENDPHASDMFIVVIDGFFNNLTVYSAIDQQGHDVTEAFFERYVEEYRAGHYDLIWQAFQDELSQFTWTP